MYILILSVLLRSYSAKFSTKFPHLLFFFKTIFIVIDTYNLKFLQ